MKKKYKILFYVFLLISAALTSSCFKLESDVQRQTPLLSTYEVINITETEATGGGEIFSDGGMFIKERGICWATVADPNFADKKSPAGQGTGSFECMITGLSPDKTYYAWAYAINNAGTWYGKTVVFTTAGGTINIKTDTVVNITSNSAMSGGNIINDGGSPIKTKGVCWGTNSKPTLSDCFTNEGPGSGPFISYLTGLSPETIYFIRAYGTSDKGTFYGDERKFTTGSPVVGDYYQGGYVAYLYQIGDPGYIPGQVHGIIAAPDDQSTGMQWYNGSYILTGATGAGLGSGLSNTVLIVSLQGAGTYAARECFDLLKDGYDDWYLPSTEELNKIFINNPFIPGLSFTDFYWTSSESDANSAFATYFGDGSVLPADKAFTYRVRAIRYF